MPAFFAPSESRAFALSVCAKASIPLSSLEEREFEGGECKLRPLESVRDRTVFVLQSLAGNSKASTSDRLVRLLFLLSGLRDAGANRLIALIPYLAYARKDRRTKPRDPVTTRYIAEMLESAGATRAVSLDVHNDAAFDNAFRIPVDHLTASPLMVDYFARLHASESFVVASPDIGGVKRAQVFRELLEARVGRPIELVFLEKRRSSGVVSSGMLVGKVEGCRVIMLDDLCATGGTLVRGAQICKDAGATAVIAAVTHVPLSDGLHSLLGAHAIDSVLTTDSVGPDFHPASIASHPKLISLSAGMLFGAALRRMIDRQPVAPLLTQWPLTD